MAYLKLHMQIFRGVSRRFEKIGTVRGCHIYDDYAHHPTEIQAVLQAARQIFPFQELIVIFQPHTYRYVPESILLPNYNYIDCTMLEIFIICSRLAALKDDFATAFTNANRVVITEV